jgi:hypothetical protein
LQEKAMQDPRKDKPQSDATSEFGTRSRDAEHAFGSNDDAPAVIVYKNVSAPDNKNAKPAAEKPAQDKTAEEKPGLYDFTPYRSREPRPQAGFDPFDMDDVDYSGGRDADNDAYGDDDEDPRADDPLFRIAERILPDRPDITNTLDVISNVDIDSLIAAGIIEEEMRGHMPDKQVDRLTAASLLAGADNAYDVLEEVPKKIADLMVDFNLASFDQHMEPKEFALLSMDVQRLVIAFNAADLEELSKGLRNQNTFAPDDDTLAETAAFLAAASKNRHEKPTEGDIRLIRRAATAFNEVSQTLSLDIQMNMTADNALVVVNKNEMSALENRSLKKSAQKKNEPKPPKH